MAKSEKKLKSKPRTRALCAVVVCLQDDRKGRQVGRLVVGSCVVHSVFLPVWHLACLASANERIGLAAVYIFTGSLSGLLSGLIVMSKRAERAAYSRIEGQAGRRRGGSGQLPASETGRLLTCRLP